MAEKSKPRLHYFPYYGRAEVIRMALKYFEIEYDEVEVSMKNWPSLKHNGDYEFKQLPMLEIEGKRLSQTSSILRYLCQRNYAYSPSHEDIAQIESIVELRWEIHDQTFPLLLQGKLAEAKEWYQAHMPSLYFPLLEKLLEDNVAGQGKHFVGSSVTMADFAMFEFGFDAFQRSQMADLGAKFAPIAPKFFAFLRSFGEERESLRRYMSEPKDKPL